ncbi:MAG: extracellular solute-binding protein, partial [Salana multivorans]|nr:extracellular solute-binding protein [Salana multivorans]
MKSSTRMRRAPLVALGLAGALALGACGSSTPGESAGETTGDGGSSSDAGSGDAVTIEFWHRTFTPVENEWYANVVKEFNAAQDKVVVKDTEVPADAWDQKMKAAQAAGKAPDIYTFAGDVDEAAQAGQFHELDSLLSSDALDQLIDAAVPMAEYDGTFYAYPLLLEPQTVLFWNTDMLEKAGVDTENAPATWDDLMAACEKIQPTLSDGQFCISPAADAVTMAWSTVGQQYNASGHTALTDDWSAPNIQNDAYRSLIQFYKDLYDKGYMPKQDLGGYLTAKDYGEGKVAYKVSGSWMMSEVGSDYSDLLHTTGIGKFPSSPDGDGRTTTTLGNFQWVIDGKAKNPEAAAAFMEWVLAGDPEVLVPFFV